MCERYITPSYKSVICSQVRFSNSFFTLFRGDCIKYFVSQVNRQKEKYNIEFTSVLLRGTYPL